MYDLELRRVNRKIIFFIRFFKLANREIYLFGVSDNTRQIIQILRENGIEPANVIDNDKTKQGSFCSRLKVIAPEEVYKPSAANKLYILYSAYWREMMSQLNFQGILPKNIWRLNNQPGGFWKLWSDAKKGEFLYNKIKRKYGNVPIFLCPYTGTGDIYLIGTFWNEYVTRNNIDNYAFIVITGACKKVAALFDIKNVELLKKKYYASWLISYYMYDPIKGKIKILNDCWPQVHTNQVEWFRGYKGLFFTNLFRKYVFDLPDDSVPHHPIFKDETERVNDYFDKYGLVRGRTVVLSPYSNTLSDLPMKFWEILATNLVKRGYMVITNSSGKTELAVGGSIGVFFPLDLAPQFIEAAGFFVGIRSGFCDVISGAKAKKIILYDARNRFYMGSAFEYFSLKTMQLCEDAVELEFDVLDIETLLDEVLNNFDV